MKRITYIFAAITVLLALGVPTAAAEPTWGPSVRITSRLQPAPLVSIDDLAPRHHIDLRDDKDDGDDHDVTLLTLPLRWFGPIPQLRPVPHIAPAYDPSPLQGGVTLFAIRW